MQDADDVQDALIEGYFRYNDLSRMEADDILMNISEIESPNYEYVDLDMLTLPRGLFFSTHRKNLAIILSRSLGVSVPVGALSSPIEVNKSVITCMSHFVFVLVFFI
jgi:hypothetical protein